MPEQTIFVRQSTGLVKSLGFLDQFFISQSIIIFLNSFVLTSLYAPIFFPGANLEIVFALGAIPAFAMAAVYSILSAAIPRSGGDYVWSTRIIGPFYGSIQFTFLLGTAVIGGLGLPTYYAVNIALSELLFSLGATTNSSSLVNLGTSISQHSQLGFGIALVIIIIGTLVALFGLKAFSWFQRTAMIIFFAISAVFVALLVAVNPSTIPSLLNHAMNLAGSNTTYAGVVQQAQSSNLTSFNLKNTLLASIPWGFLAFTGFNFGSYLSGETRGVKSSMTRALFLSVVVTTVLLVLLSVLSYRDFGISFLNSAGSASSPVLLTPSLLISLENPAVATIIGFGLFLGFIVVSVSYIVTISRMIFAASFDRLVPAKLSDVNDRFHSPYLAVLLLSAVWVVFTAILFFNGFIASFLNTSIIAPVGYLLPLVAVLAFYFKKKELFESTVGQISKPLPLIIAAAVGVGSFIFYIIAQTFPIISGTFLGASLSTAYEVVAVIIIIGVLIYVYARISTERTGIKFKNIYSELPPE
jgi:amino acid transporter